MPETQPVQTTVKTTFVCDCEEWQREACTGETFYGQAGNKSYCVLHFPADKDKTLFNQSVERKLFQERDYKFQGVWFPEELNATGQEFTSAADFRGATFNGKAIFPNTIFEAPANFENATFYAEAIFNGATFKNTATFESSRFHNLADFGLTKFRAETLFLAAIFYAEANFKESIFDAKTSFVYSAFERRAEFTGAAFAAETYFRQMSFGSEAVFSGAVFGGWTHFDQTKFNSYAVFDSAGFESVTDFSATNFSGDAHFNRVMFKQNSVFRGALFNAEAQFVDTTSEFAIFDNVVFQRDANFQWAKMKCAGFGGARFLEIANFQSANFVQDAIFEGTDFQNYADFLMATFDEVSFNLASFNSKARFSKMKSKGLATFESSKFADEADFSEANFGSEANFRSAVFNGDAHFSSATFNDKTYFSTAHFEKAANFVRANFKDNLLFLGEKLFAEKAKLDLSLAIIEKPERVSFHHCRLNPEWFLLTDPRKFEFDNVKWLGWKDELRRLKAKEEWNHSQYHIAYRQLATNAEENHRYDDASDFRFASLEARRLENFRGFAFWRLDWWYWLASCYGESVSRAFMVFLVVIILFTIGYNKTGFDHPVKTQPVVGATSAGTGSTVKANDIRPLELKDAIMYSLNVAILQKPEPKPSSFAAKLLVWLETVLGPAQAALLALAVRRRFMR